MTTLGSSFEEATVEVNADAHGQKLMAHLCPRDLYRAIWRLVPLTIFDQGKLGDWQKWESYYEQQLAGERNSRRLDDNGENALACAEEMLQSLGDRFTYIADAGEPDSQSASSEGEAVTVRRLANNVGYLRIGSFMGEDLADRVEEGLAGLPDCSDWLVDLGGNEGGRTQAALECVQLMLERGPILTVEHRLAGGGYERSEISLTEEAAISVDTMLETGESTTLTSRRRKSLLKRPPRLVYVDDATASSAEIVAGGLQANGAKLVARRKRRTRGKGIGQECYPLTDQASLYVTTMRFYTPGGIWLGDGAQTVANGLVPDIIVGLEDGQSPGAGDDDLLAAALELLGRWPSSTSAPARSSPASRTSPGWLLPGTPDHRVSREPVS
jgi:hypothetical protein